MPLPLRVGKIVRLTTPHSRRFGHADTHTIRWRVIHLTEDRVILHTINPDRARPERVFEDRAPFERNIRTGHLTID